MTLCSRSIVPRSRSLPVVLAGLASLGLLPTSGHAEQAVLSEIQYRPSDGKPEFLEIANLSATPLDIAEWRFTDGIDFTFPDFSEGEPQRTFLKSFERILVAPVDEATLRAAYPTIPPEARIYGPWSGSLANGGERVTLRDKNGVLMSSVRFDDEGDWPPMADGTGHTLELVRKNRGAGDPANWAASSVRDGTPGAPPAGDEGQPFPDPSPGEGGAVPVAVFDSTWRFHDLPADLGTAWREPGFDDTGWSEGPSFFGFGYDADDFDDTDFPDPKPADPTPLARDFAGGLVTYYFRRPFTFRGSAAEASLTIEAVLDDGAVFYLNGTEVGRFGIDDPVDWQTTAARNPVEGVIETIAENVDVSGLLVDGTNWLAVELHNDSAGSSDLLFGANILLAASSTLVINEVFPAGVGQGFVEFHNAAGEPANLKGYFLTNDPGNPAKFAIEGDLVVPPGGFGNVGYAEAGFPAAGPSTIYLVHPDGTTVLDAFDAQVPGGRSVGRRPDGGADWFVFEDPTRGEANISSGDLASLVAFNEIGGFLPGGIPTWIELAALTTTPVPAEGLFVTTRLDQADRAPLGGTIPGGGVRSWDVDLAPEDPEDFTLYLVTGNGAVLSAERFHPILGTGNLQAFPTGSGEWFASMAADAATRDAANDPPRVTSIVINEIMCDPPSDSRNGEFVELFNRGDEAVDLSGWAFTEGIDFTFPAGTMLPAGGFLVVTANREWFLGAYPDIGSAVLGDFAGVLRNEGEHLRLEDAAGNLVDQVDYRVAGDWPALANGDGSSLELVHPDADNDLPTSWRDSDESAKSSFQSFSMDGVYRQLETIGGPTDYKELHLHLVGGNSHAAVRNIRLSRNGENLLVNADRMTPNGRSDSGWLAQGTHWQSDFQGNELHLIATGHGDNRANKAEIDCVAMNRNDELTLSFEARWISGAPRLIAQTFDHSINLSARLEIPDNLGTPGAPNSRLESAPPPALAALGHSPVVPTTEDPVVVSALVSSPGGPLASVECVYRPDSRNRDEPWQAIPMRDDGLGGDAVAGDGRFAATITDQRVQGRVVEFFVRATAANGKQAVLPALAPDRPALYVVDDQPLDWGLTRFRFVISQYDLNAFSQGSSALYDYKFPLLSSYYRNMTLIVDESEAYYNAEIRPSGSPWHAGGRSNLNLRGKWKLPADRRFRGLTKWTLDDEIDDGAPQRLYHNRVCRYWLYLFGHPRNEDEYAVTRENATRSTDSLLEIVEPVGNDFLDRHWDDGHLGELYKIDDIFRFTDTYAKDQITNRYWWHPNYDGAFRWFVDDGNPGLFQTEWIKRSREADYDYSSLIDLLRTVGNLDTRTRQPLYSREDVERLLDTQRVCQMAAVRGYIGDWDNFTLRRPKNGFFYRPPGGKYQFFHWDSDLGFSLNEPFVGDGGTTTNKEFVAWIRQPWVARVFKYYIAEIVDKFGENSPRMDAWFAAEAEASERHPEYRMSFSYPNYFRGRRARAISEMGSAGYNQQLTIDPPGAVAPDGTLRLTGRAGFKVWELRVDGHPEAEFRWTDETAWEITGLVPRNGEDTIRVVGLDDDGKPATGEPSATVTAPDVTNAPPIVVVEGDPGSGHVALVEAFGLDAAGSTDPEGGALAFTWEAPEGLLGFATSPDGRTAAASFATPGLFTFAVTATDPVGAATSREVEAAVYGANGFSAFTDPKLEAHWTAENVEAFDNYSPGPWYSLEALPGRLVLALTGDTSRPLGAERGPLPDPVNIVDFDTVWRFDDSDAELSIGAAFAAPGFDDSAWDSGPGLFGFESNEDDLPEPKIRTAFERDFTAITYYLRTTFEFTGDPNGSEITLNHLADDAVRFYLNGQQLANVRLPEGPITSETAASSSSTDGLVEPSTDGPVDGSDFLVVGENVLAAELHNQSAFSSDAVFGAIMDIAAYAAPSDGGLDDVLAPWIRRELPATSDWVLQTDLTLEGVQFGDFQTGLQVQTAAGGKSRRFAFGFDGGDRLAVIAVGPDGSTDTIHEEAWTGLESVVLRIRRLGDALVFERREGDALAERRWIEVFRTALAAGTTAEEGGIFLAGAANVTPQVSFDYIMLIDPIGLSPAAGQLVLSEVMFNPQGGPSFEFLELFNAGPEAIPLAGFRFPQGAPVDEFVFPEVTLGAGEYGLVVADRGAFLARYGNELAPRILGQWSGGNLANEGEEVTLLDAGDRIVFSFRYGDDLPWPEAADGDGASLVFADAGLDPADPASWQPSAASGGSPGGKDAESCAEWLARQGIDDPLADPDGDGLNHVAVYATGLDLPGATRLDAAPVPGIATIDGVDFPTVTFRRRIGDPGLRVSVEALDEAGETWGDAATVAEEPPVWNGDGVEWVTLRAVDPLAPGERRILRLRMTCR